MAFTMPSGYLRIRSVSVEQWCQALRNSWGQMFYVVANSASRAFAAVPRNRTFVCQMLLRVRPACLQRIELARAAAVLELRKIMGVDRAGVNIVDGTGDLLEA